MRLIEQWETGKDLHHAEATKLRAHYDDAGVPVRVAIDRDPYAFQCRGRVERWTEAGGYQVVATGSPDEIHGRPVEESARKLLYVYCDAFGVALPARVKP